MRLSLSVAMILVLVTVGTAALAQEADTANIILDTSGFWRVHYTIKPPVVRKAGAVERVEFPAKWIMHDSPLPDGGWSKPGFDDSGWSRFPGVASGVFNVWGGPLGDRKAPFVALVCMRGKFKVIDPLKAGQLKLSASYRGGIVVYLNGVEIASGHLPGRGLEQLALDYAEGEAHDRRLPDVTVPAAMLRRGTNVLAVEVHRAAYQEKDVQKGKRRRIAIDWGSCGLLSVRLETPGTDGIVPNVARPQGLQLWNSNPMKVDCDLDWGDPNEELRPISVVGTRNGAFSAKVVVGSDAPIKGLKARASDLKHTEGKGVIPAAAVQVRYATPGRYEAGANERRLAPVACFDGLAEVPPDEVPLRVKEPNRRGRSLSSPGVSPSFGAVQPVWVTVNVPADAKPGNYQGSVTVAADGEKPVEVPVKLRVCGWRLPEPRDFVTWVDIIQSPESVAMQYDVPFWSDAHFKYLDESLKLLGQVGNKVAYIHLIAHTNAGNAQTMVRWIRQADGTYKYDLTPMERYLDLVQKHLGDAPVVCFYIWDTYLEGGRGGAEKYAGDTVKEARAAHAEKGPLVSVLDSATGEVESVALPMYSTPEKSMPLWKPLMEEIRKRMRKRGLEKSMMLGISTDNRPTKEVVDFFKEILPGVPWVSQGHAMPTNLYGVPVKYLSGVWAGGRFPKDPSVERTYGWKRTYSGHQSKEFSSPMGAVLVHFPRNLWSPFPVSSYRLLGEMNIAGQQRGFTRLGGDFWGVVKDKRGRGHWLAARYPETSWRNLDLRATLFSPGESGAVAGHRFEMLREGIQECEARIFIEKAILEEKISGQLAERCQAILDERIPAIRRGVSTLGCTSVWYAHAYIDNCWWQIAGVLGHEWYVGSGWQERSEKLYSAAAEVAREIGVQ